MKEIIEKESDNRRNVPKTHNQLQEVVLRWLENPKGMSIDIKRMEEFSEILKMEELAKLRK